MADIIHVITIQAHPRKNSSDEECYCGVGQTTKYMTKIKNHDPFKYEEATQTLRSGSYWRCEKPNIARYWREKAGRGNTMDNLHPNM